MEEVLLFRGELKPVAPKAQKKVREEEEEDEDDDDDGG